MNDQRKVIYEQRADIMDAEAVDDVVVDMRHDTVNAIVGDACPPGSYPEQWDIAGLKARVADVLGVDAADRRSGWTRTAIEPEMIEERLAALADAADGGQDRRDRRRRSGAQVEKSVLLERLDHHWKEHLATLDALRQVVFLRAYAQKTADQRVQAGSVRAVRADARDDPRGRHPHPARPASCASSRRRRCSCPSCPTSSPATSIRSPALGSDEALGRRRARAVDRRQWRKRFGEVAGPGPDARARDRAHAGATGGGDDPLCAA